MEYREILHESARIFNERNPKYGDMRVGMDNVAQMATIMTGIQLTAHDVALVLHAVKLSRLASDRRNPDHYVDGVNYLAFAGELIEPPPTDGTLGAALSMVDSELAKMAEQFAHPTEAPHEV
jgi:hypothetical protein